MLRRKKIISADITIIGAGVAGLATAYHVAKNSKNRLCVLEQDAALGGHASGRNAGMIRQAIAEPFIARLALDGRNELAAIARKKWKNLSFRSNGSLLLARQDKIGEIDKIRDITKRLGISTRWLTHAEAAARVPMLAQASFNKALFCPSDASLDIQALLGNFQLELKQMGVHFLFGAMPRNITRCPGGFRIDLGDKEIITGKIVNAAGAWSALLARKAGAQHIPLQPYRRHLYTTYPARLGQASWPFVWDLSLDFYFRPEGPGLLLSPCDKAAVGERFLGKRKEMINPGAMSLLFKKMKKFSPSFEPLKIKTQKSGLRTMSPDGRFVIGEDAKLAGFYWAAGLGGHGVTTCFSMGRLSGDIILQRKADLVLKKAFSPARYR